MEKLNLPADFAPACVVQPTETSTSQTPPSDVPVETLRPELEVHFERLLKKHPTLWKKLAE